MFTEDFDIAGIRKEIRINNQWKINWNLILQLKSENEKYSLKGRIHFYFMYYYSIMKIPFHSQYEMSS